MLLNVQLEDQSHLARKYYCICSRSWWCSCLTFKFKFSMHITGAFDILHQRPQISVWIRKSWCWVLYIPQSWQSQACFLGSDCQLRNLLVIGPQNIGRFPVVTALAVNVHLISLEFTHTEVVCCYLQPKPHSDAVPLCTRLSCGRVKMIVTIMCPVTETHYSLSQLEDRYKGQHKCCIQPHIHGTLVQITNTI